MKHLLENTRIATKVLTALALLGLVTVGIALLNARTMNGVSDDYSFMVDKDLPATVQFVRMNRFVTEIVHSGYRAATAAPGSSELLMAEADLAKAHKAALDGVAAAVALDPELNGPAPKVRAQIDQVRDVTADAVALARAGQRDAAIRTLRRADAALAAFGREAVEINSARVKDALDTSAALTDSTAASGWATLAMSLVGTGLGLGFTLWLVRAGIVRPLVELGEKMQQLAGGNHQFDVPHASRRDDFGPMGKAVLVFRDAAIEQQRMAAAKQQAQAEQKMVVETVGAHLDSMAQGDLTAEIKTDFPGDYAALKANFNRAIASLRELIAAVGESAAQITTGATEIATASEDLARRTESNAASLEETSAAIQQMDGRLKATAGAASRTVERADQTISTVSGGRAVADEAVQAMGRVSESAKGIDSVIEGLDKIAFQTRVLAMNAAVEAGRAGEAGRGFAVVADLVSALAMRAEEEAKRARDQLTVTQTDIVTAVAAVEKVDGALENISSDVSEVHQLLNTIATDNQAQASAITQINAAIAQMDQSTQQNAAMVEETSAAARNLTSEVTVLADQAAQFRTGAREAARAAPPARTPAPAAAPKKAAKPAKPADPGSYTSPVKPLPAGAVAALKRPDEDWNEF